MIKEANQLSISHILGTTTATNTELLYMIPPYQREYAWGKEHWENLYSDLFEADKGYFLGSIICIDDESSNNKGVLQVIDGQQRLTTLSILISSLYAAINNFIQEHPEEEIKIFKDRRLNMHWLKIQSMLRISTDVDNLNQYHNRLSLSIQKNNQTDYQFLLDEVFSTQKSTKPKYYEKRSIHKAHQYFLGKFEERDINDNNKRLYSLHSLFDFFEKIHSAIIVRISVDNMSSAFVLFESINNRGVPLTPIDLIKNMIISDLVKNSQDADQINERWQSIIKNVESYEDQVRFLRHFYHAYKANPHIGLSKYPKATKSNIIHIYTSLIKNNSQYILDQLIEKSTYYSAIISPEKLESDNKFFKYKDVLSNLKRVKSVPANAFILYALNHSNDDLSDLLNYIDNWFIRRHITNHPSTNKLDQIFLDLTELFINKPFNTIEAIQYLNKQIIASKDSQSDFAEILVNLPIYEDNTDATRALLIKLEKMERTREENVDFWEIDNKGKLVWTVEHVLPQNPAENSNWMQSYSEEEKEKWLHTLGNLTLTCYNSNLSNSDYETKSTAIENNDPQKPIGLKSGIVNINQDFINLEKWESHNIEQRGKRLANKFAALFDL